MADDIIKRLLIKLGIDGTDAAEAIERLIALLAKSQEQAKVATAERKVAQQGDLDAIAKQLDGQAKVLAINKDQVATYRQQIEAKQTTVKQIQEEIAHERAALDIRQATLKIMVSQGQIGAEVSKNLERQITLERQKLALQQAQLRATGMSAVRQTSEGGGAAGGMLSAATRGLFGGGLLGSVAGGVVGGMAAVEGVQLLMEGVRELGKSLMEAAGPAQTLRLEFEKLAARKGNDPAELLQRMREATHGLVADTQVYQAANVFLRSNIKLTTDQMVKMLGMTVDLARANGHTAPDALRAFTLAMERGQPFVLARIAGLTNLQRQMMNLPRGIDPAIASTIRMTMVMNAMTDAISKGVKPVATTLPELFTQMGVAEKNFVDGVAEGIFSTGTFGHNIQELSKNLVDLMPKIIEMGKTLGKDLADAMKWLIEHWPEIKTGMEVIVAVKLADWALGGAAALWKLTAALQAVNAAKISGALGNILPGASSLIGQAGASAAGGATAGALTTGLLPIVTAVATILGLGYLLNKAMGPQNVSDVRGAEESYSRARGMHIPRTPGVALTSGQMATRDWAGGGGLQKLMGGFSHGVDESTSGGGSTTDKPFVDVESQKRAAILMADIKREEAKVELQIVKDEIEAEQALLKNRYEMGLLDLDKYLAEENALHLKAKFARAVDIEAEAQAQKQAARVKIRPTRTPDGQEVPVSSEAIKAEAEQEVLIDKQKDLKLLENDATYQKEVVANDEKSFADRKAAEKAYQQEIIKIQTSALAEQSALLEKHFKEGNLNPDDYIAQRRTMMQQEAKIVQDELAEELADTSKSEASKATIRIKGIEEALAAQKKLTDFDLQQDQIRVQGLEANYARIRFGLQARQAEAQLGVQQRQPGSRQSETAITEQMLSANQRYIEQLTEEASTLHNQPQLWAQTVDKIKQATEEQIKLNQQLREAKDIAKPLGDLFGLIGGVAGSARGGGAVAAIADSMQKSMQSLSSYMIGGGPVGGIIGGLFGKKKQAKATDPQTRAAQVTDAYTQTVQDDVAKLKALSVEEGAARTSASTKLVNDLAALGAAFRSAAQAFIGPPRPPGGPPDLSGLPVGSRTTPELSPNTTVQASSLPSGTSSSKGNSDKAGGGFIQMLQNSTSKLKDFVGGISGAIGSVGGFIGALSGAKSGPGGALSGGMAGLSTGMQLGGPIGAAIGGVGGAIMGGIFGAKQAQVTHDVKLIQAQMQNIIDQLNNGTISISTAISNLRQERQTAISMLSGGKGSKGKKGQASQLQTVLAQIDQQMQQLLNEQKQLLDQMDQSILAMSQGIYWEPIISQLDQIVKQYQQFASAAQGNTLQVAAANEYLTQSLQNYSQTMQQTFLSDQEQAIANAQQLLQLEMQQAQMTNQYQSQVYGILSQGVTSRQLSGSQQKGAQIEALNQQYSMQQLQMQQEISVANYKYQIQQKIFGLASSQVGLEMEMVAVQDQQANQSLQSVLVMQQAMEAINAALASGNLPSLLTGATSTGGQGLAGILQLLGITVPNVPGLGAGGGQNYLTEVPGQWQGIVSYLNSIDPNFTLDVIQAMMSAPGSASRTGLVNLINNPKYGLGTEVKASTYGTELSGFVNWLTTGAALPAGSPLPPSQPGGYAAGTPYVPQTGMALIHQGEAVIPAAQNPFNTQSINSSTSAALSDASLQVEQQIYQLVMARVSAEWQLVQAKLQLLQLEQSGAGASPSGVASFEGGLAKVYETRGRYGSGGVRTEYL